MYPQQPAPTPGHNPYDFIVNPEKPTKGVFSLKPGQSFLIKVGLILIGVAALLIGVAVAVNVLVGDKTNIEDYVSLAQTQNELGRISFTGGKARDQKIKDAAMNTNLTISSQQQAWLTYLQQHGRKVVPKELALKKNDATDKQLTTAAETNTFDTTFSTLMRTQLLAYAKTLKTDYDNASKPLEKTILRADYDQVQLLLKQWPAPAVVTP